MEGNKNSPGSTSNPGQPQGFSNRREKGQTHHRGAYRNTSQAYRSDRGFRKRNFYDDKNASAHKDADSKTNTSNEGTKQSSMNSQPTSIESKIQPHIIENELKEKKLETTAVDSKIEMSSTETQSAINPHLQSDFLTAQLNLPIQNLMDPNYFNVTIPQDYIYPFPVYPSIQDIMSTNMPLNITVSGKRYEILPSTIQLFPNSEFKTQVFSLFPLVYLERDSDSFEILLDFVRNGKLHLRKNSDVSRLVEESQYYGLLSKVQSSLESKQKLSKNFTVNLSEGSKYFFSPLPNQEMIIHSLKGEGMLVSDIFEDFNATPQAVGAIIYDTLVNKTISKIDNRPIYVLKNLSYELYLKRSHGASQKLPLSMQLNCQLVTEYTLAEKMA